MVGVSSLRPACRLRLYRIFQHRAGEAKLPSRRCDRFLSPKVITKDVPLISMKLELALRMDRSGPGAGGGQVIARNFQDGAERKKGRFAFHD